MIDKGKRFKYLMLQILTTVNKQIIGFVILFKITLMLIRKMIMAANSACS